MFFNDLCVNSAVHTKAQFSHFQDNIDVFGVIHRLLTRFDNEVSLYFVVVETGDNNCKQYGQMAFT